MESAFKVGDLVRACLSAQGLKAGAHYVVRNVYAMRTPFGTFVTYELSGDGPHGPDTQLHTVRNGHLILELVR